MKYIFSWVLFLSITGLMHAQSITVTYAYDDLHRLSTATYSNGTTISFTYDVLGNRKSEIVTGACALATPSVSAQNATCGSNNGSLTVTATGTSLEYALNNDTYQTSNIFSNLAVGSYTVSVKDANNCTVTSQALSIINVGVAPTANFTSAGINLSVAFTNTSTNITGATYSWNFGDNTPLSTEANPTHVFAAATTYSVVLTVTTACGTHTKTLSVTVSQGCVPPIANFTNTTTNLSVVFANTSTNVTGATYSWNFGDNTPLSTEANPTHVFAAATTYPVVLTVTTACGTHTKTVSVTVSQACVPPIANFNFTANSTNSIVVFTNTSTNTTSATYSWNFGDITPLSTEANPTHTFPSSGFYLVILTVTTPCGTHTKTITVTVPSPIVIPCLSATPTSGLVAYYPFNGDAHDLSGNGNHGTVNGAILTTDRFGSAQKAYSFDGISNNIHTNFSYFSDLTVSLWFSASSNSNNYPKFYSFGQESIHTGLNGPVYGVNEGKISVSSGDGIGGGVSNTSINRYDNETWSFISYSFNIVKKANFIHRWS